MKMNTAPVTLQINLAPTDLPHARHILPHQLRQWAGQVDEVLCVVDLHRSRGRYAEGWQERLPGLRLLIDEYCARYPHAHAIDVDYSDSAAQRLSSRYFGGKRVPTKDWNGAPFYAYFFGIDAAAHDHIFHLDSDMMYGGGSPTWIAEAVQLLAERPDIATCCPLPGPPTADGSLASQQLAREPYPSLAFRDAWFSTRHFFMQRSTLLDTIKCLRLTIAHKERALQAILEGNPPYDFAEQLIGQALQAHHLARVQFLGNGPGMWSIHPPYRSQLFYEQLPALIQQIETGAIPEGQRGHHDMNQSMIDWTTAQKPLSARIVKHLKVLLHRFDPALKG